MISVSQFASFLGRARRAMRQGELSREPVKILRLEWRAEVVECDWLMRPSDPWDADLPSHAASENQTSQALRDALTFRNMIFKAFPATNRAELRMFRVDSEGQLELMMSGSVARNEQFYERVPSMAMRAKLCGFQFTLDEGVMERRS